MAEFQTNKETQASIERIITNAEKKLILVSPYIKLTSTLFTRLKASAARGIAIKIICRTGELKDDGVKQLATHENVELKFMANLHAKCYFNESEMIVTSLNLLESSEKNWEMGILINRLNDKVMFEKAMGEVHVIFNDSNSQSAVPTSVTLPKKIINSSSAKANLERGYCIRCEGHIPFDKDKPLCKGCYASWNEWEDETYPEKYCHFSGNKSKGETCFARPILKEYWKEAQKAHHL
jgi:phosphatidylserine/phosphatidylglycerophosphate/cardiolipin synthase-like enzyme